MQRILEDLARGLYDSFHLNFSTHISRPLMEKLAAGGGARGGGGAGAAHSLASLGPPGCYCCPMKQGVGSGGECGCNAQHAQHWLACGVHLCGQAPGLLQRVRRDSLRCGRLRLHSMERGPFPGQAWWRPTARPAWRACTTSTASSWAWRAASSASACPTHTCRCGGRRAGRRLPARRAQPGS